MLWKTEAGLLVPVRLPHRGALCRHVGPPLLCNARCASIGS
jgi:hypothetical protein